LSLLLKESVIHRGTTIEDAAIELHMLIKPAAILAMLGIGFYETANFMHYTYADRIGVGFELHDYRIGEILGFASLLGIPAALVVVWMGDRFGQLGPNSPRHWSRPRGTTTCSSSQSACMFS